MDCPNPIQPHALMFPYPAQGHINPMMQLALRLIEEGFFITFVNTDYSHHNMFGRQASDPAFPFLRFEHLPDGLPDGHKRFNQKPDGLIETTTAILALPGPFTKLVRRIAESSDSPPLTCIVADSFYSWSQEVADIIQIPRVSLWTTPVHANLAYSFQADLQSLGITPVTDQSKLQDVVNIIEGIAPMQLKDYISFFLVDSASDFLFQWCLRLAMKRAQDAVWNLGNNFEELEHESSAAFKKSVPNFLPIGPLLPLDAMLSDLQNPGSLSAWGIRSLLPEDSRCHDWLAQHEKASVIYISFGSIASISEEEMEEIILGIEESGSPFLWVLRPDEGGAALSKLREKLDSEAEDGKPSRRGLFVSWSPQIAVLTHPSVGLFLSHCGWNSLTESLVGGVPILAKPADFAEQRMNAHYVAEVWKIGHRLQQPSSPRDIKLLIGAMMGNSAEALRMKERVQAWRRSALAAASQGGSSRLSLQMFVDDMYRRAAKSGRDNERLHTQT